MSGEGRNSRSQPLIDGQPDPEAQRGSLTTLELPPWRSLPGGAGGPAEGEEDPDSANSGAVGVVIEQKEWGAGLGLDSDDSDYEEQRREKKKLEKSHKQSSGSSRASGSKSSKRGSKGSGGADDDTGVGVVEVSAEWGGLAGLSSSSDDSGSDKEAKREADRKKRLARQASAEKKKKAGQIVESDSDSDVQIGHGGRAGRASVSKDKKKKSSVPALPKLGFRHIRFLVLSCLGFADFGLQISCCFIYWGHTSYVTSGDKIQHFSQTVWFLVAIQVFGAFMSMYITFHDTDVLNYLVEAKRNQNGCVHKLIIIAFAIFFGLFKVIQVKRAWARQLSAAEIITEMDDEEDSRATTPKSLGAFGGAERAIPVALLTNVPFLLVNTVSFLTAKWVWRIDERWVLAYASIVALITVTIGIMEIDLAVSSYVFKRYHMDWRSKGGSRAGKLQCLYPVMHITFRASEVCLRVLFFAALFWLLDLREGKDGKTEDNPGWKGKDKIMICFATDYFIGLWVLKKNSPTEEKLATHIMMAMLMLVSDLTHFVDQPNFTVPAQRISFFLSSWRLASMCCLVAATWARGEYIKQRCVGDAGSQDGYDECDAINERGWIFDMQVVGSAFALYCLLRFSRPIRAIGDDLHTAAGRGNVTRIVKLLQPDNFQQVLDVNAVTKDGTKMTPAMYAAMGGHKEVLEKLMEAGSDIDRVDCHGETCLHMAAKGDTDGHVETISWLMRAGANYHTRNLDGKVADELAQTDKIMEAFAKYKDKSPQRRLSRSAADMGATKSAKTSSHGQSIVASQQCEAVPLIACGSVQLQGLFPDADDNDSPSPRALHSVSGLVFSRAAGLLARRILNKTDDQNNGAVPLGALRRVGELGKGGFGHVIEVELPNQKIGGLWAGERKARRFALKLQLKQGSQISAFSEVLALRTVHHHFIVRLERAFQTPKYFALLLELCPNDLNRMLCELPLNSERCLGLGLERTARYLGQTLVAVVHLHNLEGGGIVYRDLKPENILVSLDDEAKLTDFGLAKVVGKQEKIQMCGTMGFFPPELLNDNLLDEFGASSGSFDTGANDTDSVDRKRSSISSQGSYDPFKLDSYSFGVTLQVTLLGEDGAQRKDIRKKGAMMLPHHNSEEENIELLKKNVAEDRLSAEGLDLLVDKLLPFHPAQRCQISAPEVVNHKWFLDVWSETAGKAVTDTTKYLMDRRIKR